MLGVVGSSLKMVKLEPTTPNMSQHDTTWWPNARCMFRPTMLRYVVLTSFGLGFKFWFEWEQISLPFPLNQPLERI